MTSGFFNRSEMDNILICEFFRGSASARFDILVCVFLTERRFANNILTFAFFARRDGVPSAFDGSNRSEVVDILVSDFLLATICFARFFYIFYIKNAYAVYARTMEIFLHSVGM